MYTEDEFLREITLGRRQAERARRAAALGSVALANQASFEKLLISTEDAAIGVPVPPRRQRLRTS